MLIKRELAMLQRPRELLAHRPPPYRQVVSSPSAGDHGRHHGIEPWLALPSRLFLAIFSPALVSLALIALHVIIASNHSNVQAQDLKDQLMSACHDAEHVASLMASVPHFFADNFNDATKKSIDDTVHGLGRVLMLAVTAVEHLLVFLVDMYRSFYLCVIELLVRGTLAVIQAAVDALSGAIHDVAQSLQTTIEGSVNGINATLRGSLGGINDILKLFHKSVNVPQVAMPNLDALNNVHLPASFDAGLRQLNSSLPTLDELKQQMNQLIELPFEKLKTEINSTIVAYTFDKSVLPVPMNKTMTFCDKDKITGPISDLNAGLHRAVWIGMGILILIAILLILACLVMEWLRWRSLNKMVDRTLDAHYLSQQNDGRDDGPLSRHELFSILQLSTHPYLADKGLLVARKCGFSSAKSLTRIRWWLAWISHPGIIAILVMGIVGFISAQCQIWAIEVAVRHGKEMLSKDMNAMEADMQNAVNSFLTSVSYEYANETNAVIQNAQDDINNHVLGWVGTTTSTMNATLNEFQHGIAEVLDTTFKKTPLYTPIQSFVGCILIDKVIELEKGLTWIHNNAHISLPTVSPDALLLSGNQTQVAVKPMQDKVMGNGNGNNGIVSKLANTYLDGLERQRSFFLFVIALYFVIVFLGAIFAILSRTANDGSEHNFNDPATSHKAHKGEGSDFYQDKSQHHSISHPMLPEVVSLYYDQQRRREEAQEAQAQVQADRAHTKRLESGRNTPAIAPNIYISSPANKSFEANSNSVLPHVREEPSRPSQGLAPTASMYSLQAPSSRIESHGGSVHAGGPAIPHTRASKTSTLSHWQAHHDGVIFDGRNRESHTQSFDDASLSRQNLQAPATTFADANAKSSHHDGPGSHFSQSFDDVHLTRQAMPQSPHLQNGIAM